MNWFAYTRALGTFKGKILQRNMEHLSFLNTPLIIQIIENPVISMYELFISYCLLFDSFMQQPNSPTHPYWKIHTPKACFEVEVESSAHTSNFYNKLHTYDYMKCINYTAWINSVKNKKLSAAPAWLL